MAEENLFVYKLINIPDFSLFFYVKTATLPEKGQIPLSQQPPLKIEILSCPPPFFETLVRALTPSRRGGSHYDKPLSKYLISKKVS